MRRRVFLCVAVSVMMCVILLADERSGEGNYQSLFFAHEELAAAHLELKAEAASLQRELAFVKSALGRETHFAPHKYCPAAALAAADAAGCHCSAAPVESPTGKVYLADVAHPYVERVRWAERNEENLRAAANKILQGSSIICRAGIEDAGNNQIFYNRIGKAGSSTLEKFFREVLNLRGGVLYSDHLTPSDRGSDEYMTQSGELELAQKIMGNPYISWMGNKWGVFVYHTFFINFTKMDEPMPHYINIMRDPAKRYSSQYEFWKQLPDIGGLAAERGATLQKCLAGKGVGCPQLNYQTSYFCGHEPQCTDPPNDESFLLAAKHMVQNYAAIGTLERIDEFKSHLVDIFPTWFDPGKLYIAMEESEVHNKNKHHHPRSSSEMKQIRDANNYDALLYELANKIFDQRLEECRKRRLGAPAGFPHYIPGNPWNRSVLVSATNGVQQRK